MLKCQGAFLVAHEFIDGTRVHDGRSLLCSLKVRREVPSKAVEVHCVVFAQDPLAECSIVAAHLPAALLVRSTRV